jgi:hypothetical protein
LANGSTIVFEKERARTQRGNYQFIAHVRGGLWIIQGKPDLCLLLDHRKKQRHILDKVHVKLGHISIKALKKVIQNAEKYNIKSVPGMKEELTFCIGCQQERRTYQKKVQT